jgi:hypothetical protein
VFMSLTYFQRRRRRSPHTGKSRFCFHRGSAGNALHQLRAYVHPHVKHAIVQMQKQEVTEDNSLDNQDAVAHLHSQAVRIQKGEQVDRITALVPDENATPEFDATGVPFKVLMKDIQIRLIGALKGDLSNTTENAGRRESTMAGS